MNEEYECKTAQELWDTINSIMYYGADMVSYRITEIEKCDGKLISVTIKRDSNEKEDNL